MDETPESLVSHLNAHGFATSITNQTKHRGWILATRRLSGVAPSWQAAEERSLK